VKSAIHFWFGRSAGELAIEHVRRDSSGRPLTIIHWHPTATAAAL
jgi:hypothetical protein